jgi:hypothetical protein
MKPYRNERAVDTTGAVALLTEEPNAKFLPGGTNLVDLMKLEVATPEVLVDFRCLTSDHIVELPDGGVRRASPWRRPMMISSRPIRAGHGWGSLHPSPRRYSFPRRWPRP